MTAKLEKYLSKGKTGRNDEPSRYQQTERIGQYAA